LFKKSDTLYYIYHILIFYFLVYFTKVSGIGNLSWPNLSLCEQNAN